LRQLSAHIGIVLLLLCASSTQATTPGELIASIGFEEVREALTETTIAALLGKEGEQLDKQTRRDAAVLIALGVMDRAELAAMNTPSHMARLKYSLGHPNFKGVTGELSLVSRLGDPWQHDDLLEADEFLSVLGEALTRGVITGYDLRRKDVYAGFAPGHFFIYSHSSAIHLQQLATLMSAHGINARVFVAPKVSAFLYREDWGSPGDHVKTLPGGVRVVNGRESATLFEFASPADRASFHDLILQYAKKDEKDEQRLIAGAWWQPFYYSDRPFEGFPDISLVILSSDYFEATLTVVHEKKEAVVQALSGKGFPLRVEKVWVNPAFFRFLNGGYR